MDRNIQPKKKPSGGKWLLFAGIIVFIFLILFLLFKDTSTNEEEISNTEAGAADLGNEPPSNLHIDSLLKFKLESIAENIVSPLNLVHANDHSGRLFYTEQSGRIMILKNGKTVQKPFLDIQDRLLEQNNYYSEAGLLGIAFHPDYVKNGKFYIYYSGKAKQSANNHRVIVAEYKVTNNPDEADRGSERILFAIDKQQGNHNGGQLAFGKDGFLYISLGDGGGFRDEHGKTGNGQNINTYFGKILRIDVNKGAPYAIPADNPFVNKAGLDEIYAYGLRNPWRFSFDKLTGALMEGEVGESDWEEVNIIQKGGNYGWKAKEGTNVFDEDLFKANKEKFIDPIYQYSHSEGKSIAGGYVYRGKEFPALAGKYFFADWEGRIWYLQQKDNNGWEKFDLSFFKNENPLTNKTINSFGEDENGELYVLCQSSVGAKSETGNIYKITLKK